MKKHGFKNLMLAMAMALGVVNLSSCDPATGYYCEISNLTYGFIKKEAGMAGPSGDKQQYMDLEIGSTYWIIYDFEAMLNYDNQGGLDFYADITINNLNVVNATWSDINSGDSDDISFTDPQTGDKVNGKRTTFELNRNKDKPKGIEIVIELQPISVGKSYIDLKFGSDTVDLENYLGPEKEINVISVTLQTPILNYDELSQVVSWKHVPNADTYLFIKDNELLEYQYHPDEYVEPGQDITLTLDEIGIYSSCRLKIQAMNSKNAQFHASSYSNTVDIRA